MAVNGLKFTRIGLRPLYFQMRFKSSRTLGTPPEKARNLEETLKKFNTEDPTVHYKVNIGYALKKLSRKDTTVDHVKFLKEIKSNKELEQAARDNKIVIPLESVETDNATMLNPIQIKSVAEHYGIFEHLFGDAFFYPVVQMRILYFDESVPVYRGNVVKPNEALTSPSVDFKSKPDDLWTLVMTTPDGTTNEVERIHWMQGNIKGNRISSGDEICHYIQPLPFEGLGYLRYIFILYKQEGLVDYSDLKEKLKNTRFFSTRKFYAKRQDMLTPAGLSFFVSDWDFTVKNYYQNVLAQEPPVFEYDFPDHFYKKQVWFPLREPFNLYLDRYRDQKEIAKEYLVKKLKMTDPFKGDLRPKYPFPNAVPFERGTPLWLKNEIRKERLGRARAADYK